MNTVLVILIIGFAIATVVSLIRGIIAFLQTTKEELNAPPGSGPSASSLKQNKLMFARITFQAGAVLVIALLLLMNGGSQ
ncbi:MAG: twin transmembrane helix small protein [Sphingobium sp.]|jgi:hypothetical protein|nr:MAG: twin transmembrane helix small protein [Sphingobium sp.]